MKFNKLLYNKKMKYNYRGFFSWQGNNWHAHKWVNYIVFFLILFIAIGLYVAKKTLRRIGQTGGRRWIFKNEEVMWRTIGIIGIIFIFARLSIMWIFGYSLWWEGIGLHMCRALILVVFLLFAFNKPLWTKYLLYMSMIGFTFGILFNYEESDKVSNAWEHTGNTWRLKYNHVGDWFSDNWTTKNGEKIDLTHFEKLMLKDGIHFYSVGYDNWFIYDTYLAHIALLLFPLYIYISRDLKISAVQTHRTHILFMLIFVFFWLINIATSYSPDYHWRSNYWYAGKDEYNEMKEIYGPTSHWPWNIFSYPIVASTGFFGFHFMTQFADKLVFFEDGKKVTKIKSKNWASHKKEYSVGFKQFIKSLFIFKEVKKVKE